MGKDKSVAGLVGAIGATVGRGTVQSVADGVVVCNDPSSETGVRECLLMRIGAGLPHVEPGDTVVFAAGDDGFSGYVLGVLPDRVRPEPAPAGTGPGSLSSHVTTCRIERRDEEGIWVSLAGRPDPVRVTSAPKWDRKTLDQLQERRERILVQLDSTSGALRVELLGLPAVEPDVRAGIEAGRIILDGKEEIVLKTPKAMICLRANGDIEIVGRRIVSKAKGEQKILAPMIKLN